MMFAEGFSPKNTILSWGSISSQIGNDGPGIEVILSDGDARVLPLLRSNCYDFSRRSGTRSLEVIKLDFASEQEWEK